MCEGDGQLCEGDGDAVPHSLMVIVENESVTTHTSTLPQLSKTTQGTPVLK